MLSGHSRAMERTGFHLRGGGGHILLDAGIDLPSPHSTPPRLILLTHAHIDHANALPMILRKTYDMPERDTATHIFLPMAVMNRVRCEPHVPCDCFGCKLVPSEKRACRRQQQHEAAEGWGLAVDLDCP